MQALQTHHPLPENSKRIRPPIRWRWHQPLRHLSTRRATPNAATIPNAAIRHLTASGLKRIRRAADHPQTNAIQQLRELLDNVERMLPDERRGSSLSTLQPGDIVQIKRGRNPQYPNDNFGGCLFRVTRHDRIRAGLIHGVHLVDHRAGALEGTLGYRIEDLIYIGSIPDQDARHTAAAAQRISTEEFAKRAEEIHGLQALIESIKTEDTRSRSLPSRTRKRR
jgi:hypothetical protein